MPKRPTLHPVPVTPDGAITPACACDFGADTIEARIKLRTLSFFLSQTNIDTSADDDIFQGLAWILDDISESLEKNLPGDTAQEKEGPR